MNGKEKFMRRASASLRNALASVIQTILVLLVGLLLLLPVPAAAQGERRGGGYGNPGGPGGGGSNVRELAWQVSDNAATLVQEARSQFGRLSRHEQDVLNRLQTLRSRASDFSNANLGGRSAGASGREYAALSAAWRDVQPSLDELRQSERARRAIGQVRGAMGQLQPYYNEPGQGRPGDGHQGDGRPGDGHHDGDDRVRPIANDLADRGKDVRNLARREGDHLREGARKAAERLSEAATNFQIQVDRYHGDPSHIDEEYLTLVRRLRTARDYERDYPGPIRANLQKMQTQVDRLSYLSPKKENDGHSSSRGWFGHK